MCAQVILGLLLGLAAAAFGQQTPKPAFPSPGQLEGLKQQAAAATRPDEQVRDYIAIFEQEIDLADQAYNAGDADRGLALVNDAVADAEHARDAALKSHKNLKKVEMHVRKAARRLEEIRRTLAIDDRPPVGKAVERLQNLSRELLSKMFASDKD